VLVAACTVAAGRAIASGGDRATWGSTRLVGVVVVLAYLVAIGDATRTFEARRAVLGAFVGGVLVFNLLFVIPVLGDWLLHPFPTGARGRLSGGMFDQNSNGTLLAAVTLLALTTRPLGRLGSPIAAAVGAGLLLLTYSRTGYVAFAAGLLAYVVLVLVARRGRAVLTLSVLGVSAVVAVLVGAPHRLQEHFAHRPDTVSTRVDFLHRSVDYFSANPIFGAGFGAAQDQTGFVIHSTFFALLGEAGLVGAAAFLVLLGAVAVPPLWRLREPSSPPDVVGLLAAAACLFVASFGIDGLLHRHWWIVLGALLGASLDRGVEEAPAAGTDVAALAGRP
jgi:O-antigen ligase